MGVKKTYRPGEVDALWFNNLPQRCKEVFFDYLENTATGKCHRQDVGAFALIKGFSIPEVCQSPIEKTLYFAFELISFDFDRDDCPEYELEPQVEIKANGKKYYADFVFIYNEDKGTGYEYSPINPISLIVECDGHEFHEKTKEQVKHDNERDYDLKVAGFDVLHYSGSQIFNDPLKCAKEIYDYITLKTGGWRMTPWEGEDGEV